MARRRRMYEDVPAEVLELEVAADRIDAEIAVEAAESAVGECSTHQAAEVPEAVVEAPVRAAEPETPEHKAIGQWDAVYWRGRPLWRHRRTGSTLWKREEVWRLRNLK